MKKIEEVVEYLKTEIKEAEAEIKVWQHKDHSLVQEQYLIILTLRDTLAFINEKD